MGYVHQVWVNHIPGLPTIFWFIIGPNSTINFVKKVYFVATNIGVLGSYKTPKTLYPSWVLDLVGCVRYIIGSFIIWYHIIECKNCKPTDTGMQQSPVLHLCFSGSRHTMTLGERIPASSYQNKIPCDLMLHSELTKMHEKCIRWTHPVRDCICMLVACVYIPLLEYINIYVIFMNIASLSNARRISGCL